MSLELRRRADLTREQVSALESALAEYYRNPPPEYYRIADESAGGYTPAERPFHHDLVQHVAPGMSVLELGCGTAHLCPYVEQRGATYTGIDYSEALIAEDRRRFPAARFFRVGDCLEKQFDLVASLYAIEHVVDPPAYLERLWNYCRPGGMVGIICPEFLREAGLPPSVYYGRTPRRLREKLRKLDVVDAFSHLVELIVSRRIWAARFRRSAPGSFWINLRPRVLHGAAYSVDADAVHVVGLRDLIWSFRGRRAEILRRSDRMQNISTDIGRFNCYVLAKKPAM